MEQNTPKKSFIKPLLIGVGIILIIIAGSIGSIVGIAYGKIDIQKPELEQKIRHMVMDISFMPKTTRYVVEKATVANENVQRAKIDMSLAVTAPQLRETLDTDEFDIIVKGYVDQTSDDKSNLDVNVSITRDVNFDMKMINEDMYIKINKLPNEKIKEMMPVTDEEIKLVQDKWIYEEDTSMDSEARKEAKAYKDKQTPQVKRAEKKVQDYLEKTVLPRAKMEKDILDGEAMYKIVVPFTQRDIEYIQKTMNSVSVQSDVDLPTNDKSEDIIKVEDFEVTAWVDTKEYYVRKTIFATKFREENAQATQTPSDILPFDRMFSETVSVVAVINVSDINKKQDVTKPEKTYTFTQLMEEVEESMNKNPRSRRRSF